MGAFDQLTGQPFGAGATPAPAAPATPTVPKSTLGSLTAAPHVATTPGSSFASLTQKSFAPAPAAPKAAAAPQPVRTATLPKDLGGGAYSIDDSDHGKVINQGHTTYAGMPTKPGFQRNDIVPVSLGGQNSNPANLEYESDTEVKYRDNVEKYYATQVKQGKVSVGAARTAVLGWRNTDIPGQTAYDRKFGGTQNIFSNFLRGFGDIAKAPLEGAAEGIKDTPMPERTFDPHVAIHTAAKTISDSLNQWGHSIDTMVNTLSDSHASLLQKGVAPLEAAVTTIGLLTSPISATFSAAATVPGLGIVAGSINRLFAAIGEGSGHTATTILDNLPFSPATKDTLRPFVHDAASLAGQLIAGKAGAEIVPKLADNTKKIAVTMKTEFDKLPEPRGFAKIPGMGDKEEDISVHPELPPRPATPDEAATNYEKAVIKPAREEGQATVIGADDIKDHFGNDYDVTRHPIYSEAAQQLYRKALKENPDPMVRLTVGGPGSGKSDFLVPDLKDNFKGTIYDSTGWNYEGIRKQIDQAKAVGKQVEIYGIIPDLERAKAYTFNRAAEGKHPVSDMAFARTHAGAIDTLKRLLQDGEDVHLLDTRNVHTREEAMKLDYVADPLATLKDITYNEGHVREAVKGVTKETAEETIAGRKGGVTQASRENGANSQGEIKTATAAAEAIKTETSRLREAYKASTYTDYAGKKVTGDAAFAKNMEEMMLGWDLAEAGYRYTTDESYGTDWRGVPSSFPKYVPEELRSKDLFNSLKHKIESFEYPKSRNVRQRALMDAFYDELDSRTGVDTAAIREKIKGLYERSESIPKEKAGASGGRTRGGEAGARTVSELGKLKEPEGFRQPKTFPDQIEKPKPSGPAEVIGNQMLQSARTDWERNYSESYGKLFEEGSAARKELATAKGSQRELLRTKIAGLIGRQKELEDAFVRKWRQEAGLPTVEPKDRGINLEQMFREQAQEEVSRSGTMKQFADILERTVRHRSSIETFLRDADSIYDATDPNIRAGLLTVYANAMRDVRTVSPEAIRAGVYQFEIQRARSGVLKTMLSHRMSMPASILREFSEGDMRSLGSVMEEKTARTVKQKVNLLDYFATPEYVLEKIGLTKGSKLLQEAKKTFQKTLPKEINKIEDWRERVGKSPETAKRIFQWLDGRDGVNLEGVEYAVGTEMRSYLRDWADRLGLPSDNRLAHYITHIFESELIQKEFDPDLARLIDEKTAGSVYDPFLQRRLGMMGYKEDVWAALDAYVKRATRKESFDPALDELKREAASLDLESEKYVTRLTHRVNLRPTEIENLTDNLLKSIPYVGYKFGVRPTARVTGVIRNMYYRGLLGLNIGSALRNLTQGANTYAKLGEKYTAIGYARLATRLMTNSMEELKDTGVLSDALIQDRKIGVFKSTLQKADKGLFALFDLAEKINRGSAYFGAKAMALDRGLPELEAQEFAVRMVRETQFAFGNVDSPVFMSSDLVKTGTQLQTYSVKQIEFLGRMIKNKEYAGLVRYTLASVGMLYTIGQLFGMRPTDIIPSVGLGGSPIGNLFTAASESLSPNQQTRDKGKKDFENAFIGIIPAGMQLKKTYQGVSAVATGRVTTPSGATKYKVPSDVITSTRAALFGINALPQAQAYYNAPAKRDEAATQWQRLKAMPEDQAKAQLSAIAAKDPAEAKRIIQAAQDDKLGVTKDDLTLKALGVENGDRARAIADKIDGMSTDAQKKKYLADLSKKKILTAKVLEQVIQLLKP